ARPSVRPRAPVRIRHPLHPDVVGRRDQAHRPAIQLPPEDSAPVKARVVSGMRPTGQLHLGHLVGALCNWVPLQDKYDCFYFVADWHALTSEYADTGKVVENTYAMVADWIAAGLDPEKSTFF